MGTDFTVGPRIFNEDFFEKFCFAVYPPRTHRCVDVRNHRARPVRREHHCARGQDKVNSERFADVENPRNMVKLWPIASLLV
ncbi:hypothetical protein I546_2390 [Mycobacterium kansasii 732]|nr:hypothetical protein I546_2390 [Mycobacterium kansasii 732]